ncbi:MAG: NifU family protein, partial [Pseudomonadota bacterium]
MLAETENVQAPPAEDSERVRIIKAVIEDVRPNLQRDGGDCEFLGIEG